MTYQEQLKDDRWIEVRDRILERDYHTCRRCYNTGKELHVHHRQYIEGRLAWEYDDMYFLTLCGTCHQEIHKGKTYKDFVKPPDLIIELGARIRHSVWALKELAKRESMRQ